MPVEGGKLMHLIPSNEEVNAVIDIKLDMMLLFPEDKE